MAYVLPPREEFPGLRVTSLFGADRCNHCAAPLTRAEKMRDYPGRSFRGACDRCERTPLFERLEKATCRRQAAAAFLLAMKTDIEFGTLRAIGAEEV